ncbi:uncharacterized protein LOC135477947 [Liolophura sinensis]|uniref:uncharacterized protein LOC135477947 n=1 Tax=Liolophura sinensis TaxID=3198878 RepID=UPI0031584BE3
MSDEEENAVVSPEAEQLPGEREVGTEMLHMPTLVSADENISEKKSKGTKKSPSAKQRKKAESNSKQTKCPKVALKGSKSLGKKKQGKPSCSPSKSKKASASGTQRKQQNQNDAQSLK